MSQAKAIRFIGRFADLTFEPLEIPQNIDFRLQRLSTRIHDNPIKIPGFLKRHSSELLKTGAPKKINLYDMLYI